MRANQARFPIAKVARLLGRLPERVLRLARP